jgi:hypothetical protein
MSLDLNQINWQLMGNEPKIILSNNYELRVWEKFHTQKLESC